MSNTAYPEYINLAIRIKRADMDIIKEAAEEVGKKPSTWIREVALTVAGDDRALSTLLKAANEYINQSR